MSRKTGVFLPLAIFVVVADAVTKRLAVDLLTPPHVPHDVIDGLLRFTLTYNPGVAMGLPGSRAVVIALSVVALVVLAKLYRETPADDWLRAVALGLIVGGAVGNLWDRVLSHRGVVDFIDAGIGPHRFWTFNVADMGVSVGAVLLAALLWHHDRGEKAP